MLNWRIGKAKQQSLNEEEKIIGKFGVLMKALHKDVEVRKMVRENQDVHKLQLAHEVKYFHMEIDAWKGKAAIMVDDKRYMKITHETSLVELQEEFCDYKRNGNHCH